MIKRCDWDQSDQIQRVRKELQLASLQALRFVAATLHLVSHDGNNGLDHWNLGLLRVVNCLDLGAPQMARQFLIQTINKERERE